MRVVNVFWKGVYLLRKLEASETASLLDIFTKLVQEMIVLEPKGFEQDILRIAISKGITAYDASYAALTSKHNLILMTERSKALSHG